MWILDWILAQHRVDFVEPLPQQKPAPAAGDGLPDTAHAGSVTSSSWSCTALWCVLGNVLPHWRPERAHWSGDSDWYFAKTCSVDGLWSSGCVGEYSDGSILLLIEFFFSQGYSMEINLPFSSPQVHTDHRSPFHISSRSSHFHIYTLHTRGNLDINESISLGCGREPDHLATGTMQTLHRSHLSLDGMRVLLN